MTPRPTCTWPVGAIVLFYLLFLSPQLSAEVAAAESSKLETMVVSASRTPVLEARAGSSLTVVPRQLIRERQTIHSADLLQDLAGVAVSRVGGYGAQTQLRIRGAEANQVLVLIDGVKANDPAGGDEFDFASLTTYDIERIELVRGPQSALWGSEATAGVINITTREADAPLTARGFVEAGSRDTLFAGGSLGTGSERGSLTFNGSYYETAGDSTARAGSEDDGYENMTLGLNARWRPTDTARLSFSSRFTDTKVEFDGLSFLTGLPADADLVSENEMLLVRGEGGFVLLDDHWDNNLRLTWLDSDRQQFRDEAWQNNTSAEKFGVYYQSTLRMDAAGQRLVFAVDFEDERFEQRGLNMFGDPNQNQQRENVGWVGEYLAAPLPDFDLSLSLRHDDNSEFKDVTTYRVTGSYALPASETRLRGSYGTGQKAPTFIELYGFFPDSFVGNPDLKPEQTRGFDLGLVQGFLAGRGQVNLTYFDERLLDEIVTTFVPGSFLSTAKNLDDRSHRKGVEVEAESQLADNLNLNLSYTFTDSTAPDGVQEVRRPRHMAAANLNYAWLGGRANVNLNLSYTGSQTDQVFLPPTFAAATVKLDDYLLTNLTGSYAISERFEVYLRADNLFDEDYVNVVGYRPPGRSLHLGIRLRTARQR